jgi:hypothetical protein
MVAISAPVYAAPPLPAASFEWTTVVNNNDTMPGAPFNRKFNSYNQPSVNTSGLVVIRARSTGGGGQPATHGIYTRDMSMAGSPIVRILDRSTQVPQPNNLSTKFVETPSFPRIDIWSDTIATRGNHQPALSYFLNGTETRAGTTGIYANPFGPLITGASKLGGVTEFGEFFEVPGAAPWTMFDVFPGSPSVTDGKTIVFKGNYTVGNVGKTGVFYRDLEAGEHGGFSPVMLIANSTDTLIPGTRKVFGSTSPPSAAGKKAVFAGFDNEESPTLGGLYLAYLNKQNKPRTLVSIGGKVPGEIGRNTFNRLGEGVAFDGRFVGFWGAWGTETETVRLYCPTEGNKDRIAYCNKNLKCLDTGEVLGDSDSVCDTTGCYQEKRIPVRQGIFVHDTEDGNTRIVAKTGDAFDDFVFWNYSGKTPCVGNGHGQEGAEDDGEPARWRSSSFVAISAGAGATFKAAFKARMGDLVNGLYADPVDGIYLGWYESGKSGIVTVVETGMEGPALDPDAPAGSTIAELGLEREGLRGDWLAVNASMGIEGGTEEAGMAGIYLTRVPTTPPR